jgi:hypothetical protein
MAGARPVIMTIGCEMEGARFAIGASEGSLASVQSNVNIGPGDLEAVACRQFQRARAVVASMSCHHAGKCGAPIFKGPGDRKIKGVDASGQRTKGDQQEEIFHPTLHHTAKRPRHNLRLEKGIGFKFFPVFWIGKSFALTYLEPVTLQIATTCALHLEAPKRIYFLAVQRVAAKQESPGSVEAPPGPVTRLTTDWNQMKNRIEKSKAIIPTKAKSYYLKTELPAGEHAEFVKAARELGVTPEALLVTATQEHLARRKQEEDGVGDRWTVALIGWNGPDGGTAADAEISHKDMIALLERANLAGLPVGEFMTRIICAASSCLDGAAIRALVFRSDDAAVAA